MVMNIWNRHFECMNRDELRILQGERIRETVERVYFHVPYYRQQMQERGLGLHYGGEKTGASVIPVSGGNTKRQLQLMHDFGSTVLACTPSYALYLAEAPEESGLKREDLRLRVGVFGAEPWTENMRREIEEKLSIKAIDIDGLSEVIGPGVASECLLQKGLHINEDHFYPEIIDPDTLEVLPSGKSGELVFTTITKEGLPLIRYRTRDLTRLNYEKCNCGRTLAEPKTLERIEGKAKRVIDKRNF